MNPFAGTVGALPEIYAMGLRNPFRATIDRTTGHFFVGDVGFNSVEEINLVSAGANFGWNACEGPIGCAPGVTLPAFSYDHNGSTASITLGEVYRDTVFPPAVRGSILFGDYVDSTLSYAPVAGDGSIGAATQMLSTVSSPVWIGVGPDGNIYYIELGFPGSRIHRVTAATGNQAPRILTAQATPTRGPGPLTVTFAATATDPEAQALTYSWSFGDGTTAAGPSVQHTYPTNGSYEATLTVSDGSVAVSGAPIRIDVGGAPSASITSPAAGSTFAVGQTVSFTGSASDPDQQLAPAATTWHLHLVHDDHLHPIVGPVPGTSTSFVLPSATEHDASYRFRITMTVTDSDGLTATDSLDVFVSPVPTGSRAVTMGFSAQDLAAVTSAATYLNMSPAQLQLAGVHVVKFIAGISGRASRPEPIAARWKPATSAAHRVTSILDPVDQGVMKWAVAHYDLTEEQSLSMGASALTFLAAIDRSRKGS